MTREEAINKWVLPAIKNTWNEKRCEEILKALEQELCEDVVSRKAVHDMLENLPITVEDKWFTWLQKACMRLAELPMVTPQESKTNICKMSKEKQIQEYENKQLIDELSKMPPMVIATAYLHAINYTQYGEDVTEKWVTAVQQASALEEAYKKGYCDALQKQAESDK